MELESTTVKTEPKNLLYSILDVPPISQCILLGLQHFITMMSGTAILPTLLFKALCITELSDQSAVISSTFFVMGLATLLQTVLGTRLPIIQGASAAFFVPTFAILASDSLSSCPVISLDSGNATHEIISATNNTPVWMERISTVGGTLAIASVFQVLLGATGLTAVMMHYIGPLVVAPTICLIGLSLVPIASASAGGNWLIALLVCLLIVIFSYVLDAINVPVPTVRQCRLHFVRLPLFKSFPVLLSVGITWALCGILTASGALPNNPKAWGYAVRTDTRSRAFAQADWFRLPYPGQFGTPRVLFVGVLGMMAAAHLHLFMGDYVAAAKLSGAPRPPAHAVNRGVIIEGVACILAGIFCLATGSTSYSENIGAIGITRVGSRRVIQYTAVIMLILGICPKAGAVFVSLPEPVIGGLFLAMFGMVAGVGLSSLQYADMSNQRNVFIVGNALAFGLGVPHWLKMSAPDGEGLSHAESLLADVNSGGSVVNPSLPRSNEVSTDVDTKQSDEQYTAESLEFYDIPFGRRLFAGRLPLNVMTEDANEKTEVADDSPNSAKKNLLYSILDVPPISQCILLGLQHFITMMSGTAILPTLLFKALCITELSDQSAVISSTFFVMGLATLLQTVLGTRLPIIQGASAAFMIPTFAILASDRLPACPADHVGNDSSIDGGAINSTTSSSPVWMERISFVGGTLAVSSLFQVIMGSTGFTAIMVRRIGPLVIAPTICLIGLSLVPVAASSASSNWYVAMLVCILVILFSYVLDGVLVPLPILSQRRIRCSGFALFKSFPVLLSVGIAWALCAILTVAGAFPSDPGAWSYAARTDIGSRAFTEAAWFRLPYPGQFGEPRILAVGILGMTAGVIVSVVESIGDYVAAARLSGAPRPPAHAINREDLSPQSDHIKGVIMEGVACILSGLFGVPTGSTSYSENIGAIGITRVGSRRVIMFSAVIMLFFGISPKSGAVFVSLPQPVVGGLFLAMFGMVAGVGLSSLQYANMNNQRNVFVVGYSIILGLALPHWLRSPSRSGGMSNDQAMLVGKEGASLIVLETLLTLLKNEIFVTGFAAFLLDNLLRGSPSDRGLVEEDGADNADTGQRNDLDYYDIPFGVKLLGNWPRLHVLPFLPDYRLIKNDVKQKNTHPKSDQV
uniref:Nucleobase-ascorbate transporter 2 n=1 Tax=Macrostomum lignano TaxID=282301 RepID=A0A1I8G613_9PLAT